MRSNDQRLIVLFQKVNNQYFDGAMKLHGVFWYSNKKLNADTRSCHKRWAEYQPITKDIRINNVLRNKAPQYVISYLIYHEALHFFWLTHCQTFIKYEKKFRHFEKAERWLELHGQLI